MERISNKETERRMGIVKDLFKYIYPRGKTERCRHTRTDRPKLTYSKYDGMERARKSDMDLWNEVAEEM